TVGLRTKIIKGQLRCRFVSCFSSSVGASPKLVGSSDNSLCSRDAASGLLPQVGMALQVSQRAASHVRCKLVTLNSFSQAVRIHQTMNMVTTTKNVPTEMRV